MSKAPATLIRAVLNLRIVSLKFEYRRSAARCEYPEVPKKNAPEREL
jgi:hypothetical protein